MKRALIVVVNVIAGILVVVPPGLLLQAPAADAATTGGVLYAATGQNVASNLYILSPATGAAVSTVGPIGYAVTGLAVDPTTGILYGATTAKSPLCKGCIITINKTTGAGTLVGPENLFSFGFPQQVADITFTSDGQLYGWAEPDLDLLVSVNKSTGAATVIGPPGGSDGSGLAASGADVLYFTGSDDDGELTTVSRTTGEFTSAVAMNGSRENPINALTFACDGTTLYGNDGIPQGSLGSPQLITINTATGAVTTLGPTPTATDALAWDCSAPTYTRTISSDILGPVTVAAGERVLIQAGARVVGPVTVQPGGALTVVNAQISRGIVVDNPSSLSICGSDVSAPSPATALSVSNAAVPIQIGDPANGCAANRFAGQVTLTANAAATFGSNVVSGSVTVNNGGPGTTVIKANNVFGTLACTGNNPTPTNAGQANTASSKTGQCSGL